MSDITDNRRDNDNDGNDAEEEKLPPIPASMATMKGQQGAATDKQLRENGITWRQQQSMIAAGLMLRYGPGVVVDAATEETWHRRAMAATLAPGAEAVLSGASAARLHRLDGFADIDRIIVTVGHSRRLKVDPDVTVWQSRCLAEEDCTVVDGIPVLTIAATLVSLARTRHSRRSQALDSAIRDGIDLAELRADFVRMRKVGRRGPSEMLLMLDQRVNTRLPRSWFQRLAKQALGEHGVSLVDEWPVHDERGKLLAQLDLAHVELKVGLECQSWQWHSTPAARRADALRKQRLRRIGWDTVDLWWSDLDRIDGVIDDLNIALERARKVHA